MRIKIDLWLPNCSRFEWRALASLVITLVLPAAALAQNFDQAAPSVQPAGLNLMQGYMPKFSPSFWNGGGLAGGSSYSYMQAGTVLTGALEDKLSSKHNKAGDLFAIVLNNGYGEGGRQVLPAGAKIVGAVVSAIPGKEMRNGSPGRLDITLQTLVLPDGRSAPFYGLVEHNPNLDPKTDPNKPQKGLPLASYGQSLRNSVVGIANSVTRRGLGMQVYYPGRTGMDFSMEAGELLPVRLTRPFDVSALMRQPIPNSFDSAYSGTPPPPPPASTSQVPGLVGGQQTPPVAPDVNKQPQPDNSVFGSRSQTPGLAQPDPF